jgi:peptidoglycan/LPS O-acetylase OafA/YrhL
MGLIRLWLALCVAGAHANMFILAPKKVGYWPVLTGYIGGAFSVVLFFIISGFLISTVLRTKYSVGWSGTRDFYFRRASRILVLYWPLAALCLLFSPLAISRWDATSLVDRILSLTLLGADWGLLFGYPPTIHINGLQQSWSLGVEMTFYLFAPLVLRLPWLVALTFVASALVRAWMVSRYGFDITWTYRFIPSVFLFFLLGHIAVMAAARWPILAEPSVGFVFLFLSYGTLYLSFPLVWDSISFWIVVVLFSAALPGVFAATKDMALMNRLGDLSYPIYLVHLLVIQAAIALDIMSTIKSPNTVVLTIMGASLLAGAIAHYCLEAPLASAIPSMLKGKRAPISAS